MVADPSGQTLRLSAIEHGYIFKYGDDYFIIDFFSRKANNKIFILNVVNGKRVEVPASARVYVLTLEEEFKCNLRLQKNTL